MSTDLALILTMLVPLAGALAISVSGRWPDLRETCTIVTSLALFALVLRVVTGYLGGEAVGVEWLTLFSGVSIAFHVEPLSIIFAMIASGLWIVTSIYSIGYMRGSKEKQQTRFYVCFAIALAAAMGVAFSANLLTLFVFYEVLTLSTYPLVTHKGDANARSGGRTYLGILMTTSIVLLLPAIIWVYAATGTLDFVPGGILAGNVPAGAGAVMLALFLFGVAKAAVMPVHRWLPAAMVAPTPVSALLHAVAVVKAGVFTLIKVTIYIFGTDYLATVPWQELAVYITGFTIIAASCVALRQTNIKRMLAYSTVSQLSYMAMAAMVLAPLSEIGAAVHIAAHAFGKITLFFTAGAIYIASKKSDITQLDGIGWRMPLTMTAFAIGALSMIGVPPTAGFVSKWFMLGGALQAENHFALTVLVISTALNAAYFLPVVHRAFFRPETEAPKIDHGEAPWNMVAALSATALATLLFFFFNAPVLELASGLVGGQP